MRTCADTRHKAGRPNHDLSELLPNVYNAPPGDEDGLRAAVMTIPCEIICGEQGTDFAPSFGAPRAIAGRALFGLITNDIEDHDCETSISSCRASRGFMADQART